MCMSCNKSRGTTKPAGAKIVNGSSNSGAKRKVYSGSSPFGKPKVRMSFASRSR